MAKRIVKINRAPVLTLWAAVVAERLGHDHAAALTLGKAVAGLNAQSKGRRLGLFEEAKKESEKAQPKAGQLKKPLQVDVLGRAVPAIWTAGGLRATTKGEPIKPESVQRYLEQKFSDDLADVQAAMEALARAYPPEDLASRAYSLYEQFRPSVPAGEKGWGAKGNLDLDLMRSLARH